MKETKHGFNIQLFAGEKNADDEVLTFDEILTDKAYQAEFDRRVAKAIETAKGKWTAESEAIAELKRYQEGGDLYKDPNAEKQVLLELEELRKFKADTETKGLNDTKREALFSLLKEANAHPNSLKLLVSQFDLSQVELDDNKKVVNGEDLLKPIQEEHAAFFGTIKTEGAAAGKKTADMEAVTKDDFKRMGLNERQDLHDKNPELFKVLKQ